MLMRDASHLFGDSRVPERVWARIEVSPCGCWLWPKKSTDRDGYPNRVRFDGVLYRPVRKIRTILVGPVPDGLQLGHQCHSLNLGTCAGGTACAHRRCVNPLDVEPETAAQNLRGGHTFQRRNALVQHCPSNHWYTPENTMMVGKHKTNRACRKCYRNSWRRRHGYPEYVMEGPDFTE